MTNTSDGTSTIPDNKYVSEEKQLIEIAVGGDNTKYKSYQEQKLLENLFGRFKFNEEELLEHFRKLVKTTGKSEREVRRKVERMFNKKWEIGHEKH